MRMTQAIGRAATVAGNRIATIDGDRRQTWGELAARVACFATVLHNAGVGPGDRVAILAHNCDRFFEAYFAIPWAGAVLVPLNTRLAPAELAFQLCDAGATLLLFGCEFAEVAGRLCSDGAVPQIIGLDPRSGIETTPLDALISAAAPAIEAQQSDDALAGIFYTGGTTGLPKGVMLSHGNLHTIAANLLMSIPFDETCVNFHAAPMFHLADIGILLATMAGGTHVFRRSYDADVILAAIAENGVTHCFTVPVVIDRMAKANTDQLDLTSLRVLGYGGSAIPAASLALARERFPAVDFIQGFGQTEMAAATFLPPRAHAAGADPAKLRSCGKVCLGYEIRIVDERDDEVPRGTVGEIVGRGGNVMMGYWNRPQETADVLRDGWLHTRDAGFMDDDGYIYVTDRLKDMIVSGAENVYSIEVENALSWHPAIDEVAVIGVPDPVWGERVHAIVVLCRDNMPPTLDALVAVCRTRIAGYKCPRSFEIRDVPLPRNAAGKVLKQELRQIWIERSADAPS